MGIIKRSIWAFMRPQVLIIILALFALSAGLAGNGYRLSKVSAVASSGLMTTPPRNMKLQPDTGIQLPPKPLTFSIDCSLMPCVALTFDDGPDPAKTPVIVEALEKAGAKATFFVIGNRIAGHEALLQHMQADGFDIGNHSWSHLDFTKLGPEQIADQINKTQNALQKAGVEPAQFFRLPYGFQNEAVRSAVSLPIVLWNVDPKDWHEKDPKVLATNIESLARPGAIMVMHDTEATTTAAVSDIINRLQQHYQLVTISELVQIPQGARGGAVIY